jgi:alanyl aminopeptidase
MQKILAGLLLAFSASLLAADPVSPTLRLGDVAAPRAYSAQLAVDPRAATFSGEIRIELTFKRATPVLWLNGTKLEIESAEFQQGERRIKARAVPGAEAFIGFVPEEGEFAAGDAIATIRYRGTIESVDARGLFKRQEEGEAYVITQFEPLDARRAFPCFDEPGWKVPWQLAVDAPQSDFVASNTPETSVADTPGRAGWKRHVFARTQPLPSYLVALAVGPFDVVDGGTAGMRKTPLRYLAPKGRGAEMRFAKESTPRIIEILEAYFGIPFPFEKLDTVVIPNTLAFGAMENAGMITYQPSLLLARPHEETVKFKRGYVEVGGHEIAHQWFGDLVTMAWWDDVWLNEAFATWMEKKIVDAYDPALNAGWQRGESRREALAADRLASARRIQNPVASENDIYSAFDGITYQKGNEVLSMFEAWLGPERFQRGVRDYFAEHAGGNATSKEFFGAIAKASGRSDAAMEAFRGFVEQPGLPLMDVSLRCSKGPPAISISQHRFVSTGSSAPEMSWTTPACFRYRLNGAVKTQCEEIRSERRRIGIAGARPGSCPDWLVANAEGAGHSIARYDAEQMQRLEKHLATVPEKEAVALAFDTSLLADSGLMSTDDALTMADALLRHASPAVQEGGVYLLEKQRDEWLTAAGKAKKKQILAQRVQPMARRLGWTERPNDSQAVRSLRVMLLPYAAREAGGESLRPQAKALALRWLDDRQAVSATMIPAVLESTARFADAATYDRLEAATLATVNQRERTDLLQALAHAREGPLRQRAMSLTMRKQGNSNAFGGGEVTTFLGKAMEDEANRGAAFDFVRGNWDDIMTRIPAWSTRRLMGSMRGLCTPSQRDSFAAFFKERAPKFPGGPMSYAQTLENIDICVASHPG